MLLPVNLSALLKGIVDVASETQEKDCIVSSITQDSREAFDGCLFVALKGLHQHGLKFAEQVQEQGACAIIWESDENISSPDRLGLNIPCIEIANLRAHLGLIADRFYQSPSKSLNIIGITGTDGKTSVSHFLAQSMDDCAVIGTIGLGKLDNLQKATHTTPDVLSVHKTLAELKEQNIKTVAMEVSSHALDQERVANVQFDVAVLTNLSRDHLDYHKTLEAYAEAKAKLFSWSDLKDVVLNIDDAFGQKIAKKGGGGFTYSIADYDTNSPASLIASNAEFTEKGIRAIIHHADQQGELNTAVLGRFNLSNLLAALGTMLVLGVSLEDALARLNKVHTVEGRMEKISNGSTGNANTNVLIVVDFAHTPNALKTVLKALREHTQQSLICVFGCGGDRDAGKRPLMAAVAEKFADKVIATDDNPRTENPQKIMADIVSGFKQAEKVTIEHDRAAAIQFAVKQAKTGDVVLIAGKGHEKVQILATGTIPFSDQEQANKVLQELAA